MKILLVAKPWRGGLAKYVYLALEERCPGCVEWVVTRPVTKFEQVCYRLDKKKWAQKLLDKINKKERDIAIFINTFPGFCDLDSHPGNILWLTDGPNPAPGEYDSFAKVYLSDPGYLENVARVVPAERIGGELAFACCPQIHFWNAKRVEQKQVCFIGNKDPKRDSYVKELLTAGLSLSVVGNYFLRHPLFWHHPKFFLPPVENEGMGKIYSQHSVSLNLHAKVIRQGTNMRTFECAAYGIPQLVEYCHGIEKYFDLEDEIITFKSLDEMLERLEWYLGNDAVRKKIAEAAKERVLSEHTYQHRLNTILSSVG